MADQEYKRTVWQRTGDGRIDYQNYQNNDYLGTKIHSSLEGSERYANYSFQSGNQTHATVFIHNKIVASYETIKDAFKAYKYHDNEWDKYGRLLRVLMTMMLFSNNTKKKIVITRNQLPNVPGLEQDLQNQLDECKQQAKNIF